VTRGAFLMTRFVGRKNDLPGAGPANPMRAPLERWRVITSVTHRRQPSEGVAVGWFREPRVVFSAVQTTKPREPGRRLQAPEPYEVALYPALILEDSLALQPDDHSLPFNGSCIFVLVEQVPSSTQKCPAFFFIDRQPSRLGAPPNSSYRHLKELSDARDLLIPKTQDAHHTYGWHEARN